MDFTYTEKNGKKPIEEWLAKNLKTYAEKEHGIRLDVDIKKEKGPPEKASEK